MSVTEGTPFVVFGDDWGRYPSTIQHVFRHIAPRYPVVWVNSVGFRVPGLNLTDARRAWEKLARTARAAVRPVAATRPALGGGAPAAVIEPRVLPWHHLPLVHALNTRSLVGSVRRQLNALRIARSPVLVTGSPPTAGVVGRLGELASVYYVLDDFLHYPGTTPAMLAPLARRLLERVDIVVATAESLTRSKRPRSGRTCQVPQGVNYTHFAEPRPEPADLAGIARPRIGFAGGVATQCDVALLARLAVDFPDASLVLVGPVSLDRAALEPLQRPNVHVLGLRPYRELPAYVQHFDVGIIPYVISPWTVAVDPLKLLEYLAAGLPVVTTAIPEAAKYAGIVAVAGDHDAFVAAVRAALAADRDASRERGQAFARQHTWERRADRLLEVIEGVIRERREAAPAALLVRPQA